MSKTVQKERTEDIKTDGSTDTTISSKTLEDKDKSWSGLVGRIHDQLRFEFTVSDNARKNKTLFYTMSTLSLSTVVMTILTPFIIAIPSVLGVIIWFVVTKKCDFKNNNGEYNMTSTVTSFMPLISFLIIIPFHTIIGYMLMIFIKTKSQNGYLN